MEGTGGGRKGKLQNSGGRGGQRGDVPSSTRRILYGDVVLLRIQIRNKPQIHQRNNKIQKHDLPIIKNKGKIRQNHQTYNKKNVDRTR